MLNNLREAFRERVRGGACQHALTEAAFWVHDPPRRAEMPAGPCQWHSRPMHPVYDLAVANPDGRLVHLILTDKCLYLDRNDPENEPSRCDCVLLLPEERAYFVEFKKPEPGREKTPTGDDRYLRVQECLDQLESTIKEFARHGIITSGTTVMAHACVGHTRQRPYQTANYQEVMEAFRRRFEGLKLRIKLVPLNELDLPPRSSAS